MLSRILQRLIFRLQRTASEHQVAFFIGAIALVAFVLLSSRMEGISLPIPASGGVKMSPPAVAAPSGTVEAVIQGVILRGNQEQERAVASRNMTVMQDTATPAYYQETADMTQQMVDNGITSIQLTTIEWGDIRVDGANATATTWETWVTSASDGSTEQSRDRNVYKLVQVGGAWKITADDHPDSGPSLPGLPFR
ncbi:MAG TPA: hypothetical protein VGK54_04715 [Chloroflexota bacterium]|jgi:hypothetical protein